MHTLLDDVMRNTCMRTIARPQATPRFYLAAVAKNRLRDKIWEWPGDEAMRAEHAFAKFKFANSVFRPTRQI